jgi:thiol-disulfide isomerase/thioredoxin
VNGLGQGNQQPVFNNPVRSGFFLLVALLLSGCGGGHATPAVPTALHAVELINYIASDPTLVKATGRPQVVVFFTFSSTASQALRPVLHQLQDEYADSVDFIYMDEEADNTKPLQKDMLIAGAPPTVIFLSAGGEEQGRLTGVHGEQELADLIDGLLMAG